jgi:hypothetical protein
LYTDGGLRVAKDSFVSGTAYFNNVVVYGTSSIQYITSSQVNFGTNIITVNTDTPAVRFGGLAVFDSGSTGLTGSMLWDSEKNYWVYSNPSGSTYSGGMIISGPRNTGSLGNEVGTTACAMMIGQGGDHITSSAIFSYGNATCFYGQSFISSSGAAYFNGCVGIGSLTSSGYRLEVTNPSCASGYANVFYGLHNANNTITIKQFGANHPTAAAVNQIGVLNAEQHLYLVTDDIAAINAGTSTKGIFLKSGGNVGIGTQCPLDKLDVSGALRITGQLCINGVVANTTYIDQAGGTARFLSYGPNSTTRGAITFFQASSTNAYQFTGLTLDPSGNATFGGNICSGTINGTTIYGSTAVCSPVGKFTSCIDACAGYFSGVLQVRNTSSTPSIWSGQFGGAISILGDNSTSNRYIDLSIVDSTGALATQGLRLVNSGNVGIGISTPCGKLDVYAGSYQHLIFKAESANQSSLRFNESTNGPRLYSDAATEEFRMQQSYASAGFLTFYTGPTERMRITSTGIACFACQVCAPRITINSGTSGVIDLGQIGTGGIANQIIGGQWPCYAYTGRLSFKVGTWGVGSDYGPTEQMSIEVQGADTKKSQITMAPYGGSIISCGDSYFCGSTYGIMGFGCKVFDKTCYVMTTTGTICLPLDGLGYANGPTRAIYIYGSLLGNDSLQYAHMVYYYRNDYGGLQAATVAQASCAHASTAGQVYTYTVNDPVGIGKENCTLNLRLTSCGAGVAPGSYCTQMRIVVYNVPG